MKRAGRSARISQNFGSFNGETFDMGNNTMDLSNDDISNYKSRSKKYRNETTMETDNRLTDLSFEPDTHSKKRDSPVKKQKRNTLIAKNPT